MRSLCLNLALVGGAAQSLPHSNVLSLTTKELAISPSHRYSVCDVRMSNDSAELGVSDKLHDQRSEVEAGFLWQFKPRDGYCFFFYYFIFQYFSAISQNTMYMSVFCIYKKTMT